MKVPLKILFVCGKNKWRSPTAVNIYRSDNRLLVRSAGVSAKSQHQISSQDIFWADLILVMQNDYKRHIIDKFDHLNLPPIEDLNIPDEFKYMDTPLIKEIEVSVGYLLKTLKTL